MKRLTYRNELGDAIFVDGISVCPNEVANRLAYYEDMEEQGRLDVWPCSLGTHVYWVHNNTITECHVYRFHRNRKGQFLFLRARRKSHGAFNTNDIGKTVFLTREEAENALKGGAVE